MAALITCACGTPLSRHLSLKAAAISLGTLALIRADMAAQKKVGE